MTESKYHTYLRNIKKIIKQDSNSINILKHSGSREPNQCKSKMVGNHLMKN